MEFRLILLKVPVAFQPTHLFQKTSLRKQTAKEHLLKYAKLPRSRLSPWMTVCIFDGVTLINLVPRRRFMMIVRVACPNYLNC